MKTKKLIKCQNCQKTKWWKCLFCISVVLELIFIPLGIIYLVDYFHSQQNNNNHIIQQLEIYDHATNNSFIATQIDHQSIQPIGSTSYVYAITNCPVILNKTTNQFANNLSWAMFISVAYHHQILVAHYTSGVPLNLDATTKSFFINLQMYLSFQQIDNHYEINQFKLLSYDIKVEF